MIIAFIISWLLNTATFLISYLPASNLPAGVSSGINSFVQTAYAYNSVLPIDTAIQILKWTVAFWAAIFVWDIIKWVIHLIRGN